MARSRPADMYNKVFSRRGNANFPAVEARGNGGWAMWIHGRFRGRNNLSDRYELTWTAGEHGKPGLNALLTNSVANYAITDRSFEILGTNSTSALCTYNVEGGIKLTTAGASADQMILLPHLLANNSPWTATTWGTDQSTIWSAWIKTGASIASTTIWAGLKLTNTSVTTTDNDQVFFRYGAAVNSGKWQAVYSKTNVDTASDTGITVAASTEYYLRIGIDSDRVATMFINGTPVLVTAALVDAIDLIPYIGVQADTAAAKTITIFGQSISRTAA